MASISLRGVSTVHPGKNGIDLNLVNNLDLEIQDREFVVLAGPPNCGIASVVRLIAGLDEASQGEIFVGDRRVNDLAPKERDIAMVPQNYVSYPRMSVHENLAFPLTLRKFSKAEIKKRVLAAAGLLGLNEVLECKPESLTDDQFQRVAIARAIALQPKAFLFDRTLSTLEAEAREQLRNEIVKLHQRLQVTMLHTTHDPIEAIAMGGRIIVMNDGVIEQDGSALTLYDAPANVFVAQFMVPSMNFVQGTLKQDREWVVFTELEDGTINVRLPVSEFPGARDLAGGVAILGIRPEAIKVPENTKGTEQVGRFPALIDLVEPGGAESNLYLQTGAHTLRCRSQHRMDPREAGHRSQFELDIGKLCLFDPISHRRIV